MKDYSFHRIKKEVGLATLDKFNYSCVACGSKKNLCVHHATKETLIVLCRPCHMSFHRRAGHILTKGGRRGNNPPIMCVKCGKPQHAKQLCREHYRKANSKRWYGR